MSNCERICIPLSAYDPELHTLVSVHDTEEECLAVCECNSSAQLSSDVSASSEQSSSSDSSLSSEQSSSDQSSSDSDSSLSSDQSGSSGSSRAPFACSGPLPNSLGIKTALQSGVGAGGYGWRDVAYGNGVFVVVGENEFQSNVHGAVSVDGANWSSAATGAQSLAAIAFNGSFFLATSNTIRDNEPLIKSTDGVNWVEIPFFSSIGLTRVSASELKYMGGRFVAIDEYAVSETRISTSLNGEDWNTESIIPAVPSAGAWVQSGQKPGAIDYNFLTYANGKYYKLGIGAPTGTAIPPEPVDPAPGDYADVPRQPVIAISEDNCQTWTIQPANGLDIVPLSRTTPFSHVGWAVGEGPPQIRLTYGCGRFVALIEAGEFEPQPGVAVTRYITAISDDGINWEATENATITNALPPILGPNGTDGTLELNSIYSVRAFKYINGYFTIVASDYVAYTGGPDCVIRGVILYSKDGIDWAANSIDHLGMAIAYGGGTYIVPSEIRGGGLTDCAALNTDIVKITQS